MPKTSTTAEAYDIICDMEEPLIAVKDFARLIAGFVATMGDSNDGAAVQAAAYHIVDLAEAVEERRGKAFRLLHPNREHFDRVGWPDDKSEADEAAAPVPTVAFVRPSGDK
jgi:hypothetical protein